MAAKISYFILFGIITVVNARPAADNQEAYIKDESDLQKILQLLAGEGKYDIVLDDLEDEAENHFEDKTRILQYNDDKPRDYYNKQGKQYVGQDDEPMEGIDYNRLSLSDLQAPKKNAHKSKYKSTANDVLSDLLSLDSNNFKVYKAREDDKNNEDIEAFLNDLQRDIADDGTFVSEFRCVGNRCGRNSNDNDDAAYSKTTPGQVNGLKLDTKLIRKKIKLSDDLDAIVLGMSDVDRLLSKTTSTKSQQTSNLKGSFIENLEKLLNGKWNNKRSNVEAVVFDLTRVDNGNGEAIASQIKQLLSGTNEERDTVYSDYVNFIEKNLEKGVTDTAESIKKNPPNILAHNEDNNNVYVPQWQFDIISSKADLEETQVINQLKSILPKSKKANRVNQQKKDYQQPNYRRNYDQEVGVPFHLEVQGLGQVNPTAP